LQRHHHAKVVVERAGTSQRDPISQSASMPVANAGSSAAASNDSKAQIEVERANAAKNPKR
jgi:hypothetical protein